MTDFRRIFIRGSQSVAAFQRLCERWKAELEDDHLFFRDLSKSLRAIHVQSPYNLAIEDHATPTSVVVYLQRTTGTMQDTLELFEADLIAHGILNYDLDPYCTCEVQMTEETKKPFDAPWRATDLDYVEDANGFYVCKCETHLTASNIAHLPELYDALMHFVVNDCPHAFISNDECRLCPDKKCKTREAVKLLRKVRDGE